VGRIVGTSNLRSAARRPIGFALGITSVSYRALRTSIRLNINFSSQPYIQQLIYCYVQCRKKPYSLSIAICNAMHTWLIKFGARPADRTGREMFVWRVRQVVNEPQSSAERQSASEDGSPTARPPSSTQLLYPSLTYRPGKC